MPTYEFQCTTCGGAFERRLSLAAYDVPQSCECGGAAQRLISMPNFVLVGDAWPGKANKINNQMRAKNARLDRKQNELKREAPVARLEPNVGGERTDSWADAQKLAASRGKDAASYTPMVRAEKAAQK